MFTHVQCCDIVPSLVSPFGESLDIGLYFAPQLPAVLIIFTGRVGAGNPPLPTVRVGAGRPSLVGWWLWRAGCISQDTYLLYDNSQGRDLRSTKDTLDLETHIAISIIFEKPHSMARPEGKIKEN